MESGGRSRASRAWLQRVLVEVAIVVLEAKERRTMLSTMTGRTVVQLLVLFEEPAAVTAHQRLPRRVTSLLEKRNYRRVKSERLPPPKRNFSNSNKTNSTHRSGKGSVVVDSRRIRRRQGRQAVRDRPAILQTTGVHISTSVRRQPYRQPRRDRYIGL